MRKRLGLGVALWAAASAGWAFDWKTLKPQGYVSDFAGVVDPAGKAQLEAFAARLRTSTGAEIALVAIPSLQGEPVQDVAQTIARAWGVGRKGHDGILLLLAIQDRRSRMEIGPGLQAVLPGGLYDAVLREMRPALRAGQYGEALMAAAETLGISVARARHIRFDARLPRRLRPTPANSLPWLLIVFGTLEVGFFGFLALYAIRRAGGGRRAFRPVSAMNPSAPLLLASGAPSGGGFGGYDSSDSFGGFGGGDRAPSGRRGSAACDW